MLVKWPKVSVIISTYDRPKMLVRALESVLAQDFRDFEVLVVDDGSNTAASVCGPVESKFSESGILFKLLNMPENSGYQSAPKNVGIHNARGSYIAYLDDDNVWDCDHLGALVEEIESSGADIVYGRWRYRGGDQDGDFPYTPPSPAALAGLTMDPSLNFIDTSAILHSKAGLVSGLGLSLWNEEIRRFGDWDLMKRCVHRRLKFSSVNKVTFTYWWHGENLQLTRPAHDVRTSLGHSNQTDPEWSGAGESVWRG